MPLLLTSDQELVQKVVRELAGRLREDAAAVDRHAKFPRAHLEPMASLGLLGLLVPPDQGGAGTDTVTYLVAVEETAAASGTDAATLVILNAGLAHLLSRAGTPDQKARFLAPLLAGKQLGSLALTEEAGGSGLTELYTKAERQGDGFSLRGSKAFVSFAPEADFYVVLAELANEGPTLFLVERSTPGTHAQPAGSTLGLRGLALGDLYLDRARVPGAALLGTPGEAFSLLKESLLLARLGVSAALVGLTKAAFDQSRAFAEKRIQFGQPILQFGAIRGMLADVQTELEAARATAYAAASLRDAGREFEEEVYEARLLAHRIAVKGTRIAHKVHGGAGYMRDLPLERISRDVRSLMHLWDAQDITRGRLAAHLFR